MRIFRKRSSRDSLFAYSLLVIPLALILGIKIFPIYDVLRLSFYKVPFSMKLINQSYVGLGNYYRFLEDEVGKISLYNTAYFVSVNVTATILLALCIALVMNEEFRGKNFLRTIFLIPWAIPVVVHGQMWKWIYSGSYGVLNAILIQLHIINKYVNWLGEPGLVMNAVIFADVWAAVPLYGLIFLSALQMVPIDLYESAHIDGANRWERFIYITAPMMKGAFFLVSVWSTMRALKVFDLIFVLTQGGPMHRTTLLSFNVYQTSFIFARMGYGAMLASILFISIFAVTILYLIGFRLELKVK